MKMSSRDPPTMLLLGLILLLGAALARPNGIIQAVPLEKANKAQLTHIVSYFMKFGYTDHSGLRKAENSKALTILSEDMKRFQKLAGLKETGELDASTSRKLSEPRCPAKDDVSGGRKIGRRRKRWTLQGSKWTNRTITYSIENNPTSVRDQLRTNRVLEDALDSWAKEADISFKKISHGNESHIHIKFVTGDHGDGEPFDGPGGTLAHAFFPLYGGDVHFDDAERWSVGSGSGSGSGSGLYVAATHELGHSLGLAHSRASSVMSPWYQSKNSVKNGSLLTQDDVDGIQKLYGRRESGKLSAKHRDYRTSHRAVDSGPSQNSADQETGRVPITLDFIKMTRTKEETEVKSGWNDEQTLCDNARLDAALCDNGTGYVFQGALYWRLTASGYPAEGYPRSISTEWDGAPSSIDAALFSTARRKAYMFKGAQVWTFTENYTIEAGYPRPISAVFPGMAGRDISAAFEWGKENLIYMVKGNQYWKQGSGGPRPLSDWPGLPATIDAAARYSDGRAYVFSGQNYYRLTDKEGFEMRTKKRVPLPKRAARYWFHCPHKEDTLESLRRRL